jgi:hypothetical protein
MKLNIQMSLSTHLSIHLMAASTLVTKFVAAVDFARGALRPNAEGVENRCGYLSAVNRDIAVTVV